MIKVTCAIIEKKDQVLCAQRSEKMSLPYKWEFPGGKVEQGESFENCLIREIEEELSIKIQIKQSLPPTTYTYDNNLTICFYPYVCKIVSGEIKIMEHHQVIWLPIEELPTLDWADADIGILENYLKIKLL